MSIVVSIIIKNKYNGEIGTAKVLVNSSLQYAPDTALDLLSGKYKYEVIDVKEFEPYRQAVNSEETR